MDTADSTFEATRTQLKAMLDSLDSCLAMVDLAQNRVIWCSDNWVARMPDLASGACWSDALADCEPLRKLCELSADQQAAQGQVKLDESGCTSMVKVNRLHSGELVVQLEEAVMPVNEMHHYMQAREHMFTTSRTISVSEMATTLAHEIRQPLAAMSNIIKGVRHRMSTGGTPVEVIDEALEKALEQVVYTNSVISRIRDFTQARRPQEDDIDLVKLVREALSLMDWMIRAQGIQVSVEGADDTLWCKGDPTMLQQVMINLLRNGIEAMQDRHSGDRKLEVCCSQEQKRVRITVRDNGHGIQGNETILFMPFSTSKSSGMGVGLNICRSFVELHQGRLWLSPIATGGCAAHMELPRVESPSRNEPIFEETMECNPQISSTGGAGGNTGTGLRTAT